MSRWGSLAWFVLGATADRVLTVQPTATDVLLKSTAGNTEMKWTIEQRAADANDCFRLGLNYRLLNATNGTTAAVCDYNWRLCGLVEYTKTDVTTGFDPANDERVAQLNFTDFVWSPLLVASTPDGGKEVWSITATESSGLVEITAFATSGYVPKNTNLDPYFLKVDLKLRNWTWSTGSSPTALAIISHLATDHVVSNPAQLDPKDKVVGFADNPCQLRWQLSAATDSGDISVVETYIDEGFGDKDIYFAFANESRPVNLGWAVQVGNPATESSGRSNTPAFIAGALLILILLGLFSYCIYSKHCTGRARSGSLADKEKVPNRKEYSTM